MRSVPNVLVVVTHDTGRHISPYERRVETPNLARLAAQGVVFDQAFCTAPQCSPSRASILTGQTPHTHGLVGLTHRGFRLNPGSYQRTLPALLANAGYSTYLFGFQHEAPDPRDLGYQNVVQEPVEERFHCRTVTPRVVEFLARCPTQPFFAMVGFTETHRPFSPTDTPLTNVEVPPYLPDAPVVRRDVADLNEQVRRADAAIGQILDALEAAGLAENTLFIYTTDHGIAFPGAKGTMFDPGLEVSLLARGPAGFQGGRRLPGLVSNVDLYSTILDLCEVTRPDGAQGVSLLPMVQDDAPSSRDAVFGELTYHTTYDPTRAIRTNRYKYVRSFADRPFHLPTHVDPSPTKDYLRDQGFFEPRRPAELLFDLERDPLERTNLAHDPEHQSTLESLRARLEQWMRATGDPLCNGDIPAPPGGQVTPLDSYDP